MAGWHPPSLPTAPARGICAAKLSYQRPENGEQVNASPQLGSGNVRNIETRGEAVAVDLGGGQILFVLLCDSSLTQSVLDPQWKNDWVESGQRISARKTPQEPLAMSAQGSKYWGWSTGYPMLVRFKDIRDPKSVEKVTPNDIAKSFGPGVKLRRITVQITDDPVTTGIEKRLGWLERQQGSLRPADLTSSEETKQLSVVTDTSFWQGVNQ